MTSSACCEVTVSSVCSVPRCRRRRRHGGLRRSRHVEADGEGLAPGRHSPACISATTVDESTPPDRNAPSGTSAIMRRRTASCSRSFEAVGQFGIARRRAARLVPPARRAAHPNTCDVRLAVPGQSQDAAGLELVDAFVDRVRGGDVVVPQIGGDRAAVDRAASKSGCARSALSSEPNRNSSPNLAQ